MIQSSQLAGATNLMTMSAFDTLKQIPTYVAENILKVALEVKLPHMVVESNDLEVFDVSQRISVGPTPDKEPQATGPTHDGRKDYRLYYIYLDEPLGFEKDPVISTKKM